MPAASVPPTPSRGLSIVESPSAAVRLEAASRFVSEYPPGTEILIVAASRQAADDFVRALARSRRGNRGEAAGATFGLRRFSCLQAAAFLAAPELARRGLAPASTLGVEAITARAAFDARCDNALAHMSPIADRPGFPSALAATIADLRAAGVGASDIPPDDPCLADLATLLARFEGQLESFGIARAATILRTAAASLSHGGALGGPHVPLLLLDVPIDSAAVRQFVGALIAAVGRTLATVPANDSQTLESLVSLARPVASQVLSSPAPGAGPLARVQNRLFQFDRPDAACAVPDAPEVEVDFFSAPGEGREAIEIARRVVEEAAAGTAFDRMAVLLRAPQVYGSLLETAFRRARVPAWFARGTSRPDPSGRAFLALLACALERLSARRFAEYLSLGQVPEQPDVRGDLPATARWVPADDELLREPGALVESHPDAVEPGEQAEGGPGPRPVPAPVDDDSRPVMAGTLRAPWRWEELLVEAAVVGGRDRWERRLDGLAGDLDLRLRAVESEDPDAPRVRAVRRAVENLRHLRQFALPVIDRLAALPGRSDWRGWLDHLDALAPVVLRRPERVLAVLAELRPMSEIGPVTLEEVHRVLAMHLAQVRREPPAYRYGAVLVATPDQARGRSFDVVFVPGLAERVFPQRVREDPLLVDERRRRVDASLPLRNDAVQRERSLLRVAAGAASRRLCLSYPTMELTQARARVPSFYALDVERARTGRVPDFEVLAERAQRSSGARLAWPAPTDPSAAIDDGERDLAVLGQLLRLQQQDRAAAKGRARFLLALNAHLARALRARWLRARRQWSAADGLYRAGAEARECLAAHRLRARPHSVSALQRFAACPYQFLLGAVHRLEPRAESAWLEQMDPLQRGEIFHRVQADVVRWLVADERRLRGEERAPAFDALDRLLDAVAEEYYEQLAPAIDRVWDSEIESMRTDLRGWLQRLLDATERWQPCHAELGFGFGPGKGRDPASTTEAAILPGGWQVHGFVDLVERNTGTNALRVTDHKTGRARTAEGVVVGGGEALQPVVYGLALETALGRPVEAGRLFYCTLAGRYEERVVPLDGVARRYAGEVFEIIDRAIDQGSLPPAPRAGACEYCDFRRVCGPDEERRIARKDERPLADLVYLRGLR